MKRINLEIEEKPQTYYEAVIAYKCDNEPRHTIRSKTFENMSSEVEVWLRDPKYKLLSADRVELVSTVIRNRAANN